MNGHKSLKVGQFLRENEAKAVLSSHKKVLRLKEFPTNIRHEHPRIIDKIKVASPPPPHPLLTFREVTQLTGGWGEMGMASG